MNLINNNKLIHFNLANRDKWVAQVAASLPTGTKILDVGAGPCRYKPLFEHCVYKSQDFSQYEGTADGLLKDKNVWGYGQIDYISDITAIPVENGSFDAILCTEVLEHVPEPILALKEIGRILKVGGKAFISAPLGSGLHQQPYHFYGGYTPHFYHKFLEEFGFEITRIEPNGRFFRLLLQEIDRGVDILIIQRKYARYHPIRVALKLFVKKYLSGQLTYLDDQYPIDEFTVGYHVEAIKIKA